MPGQVSKKGRRRKKTEEESDTAARIADKGTLNADKLVEAISSKKAEEESVTATSIAVEYALDAETLAEAISSKKAEDTSVVSIHSGDLLHKCDDCWECFERSQLLIEHRGVEHKVVKR